MDIDGILKQLKEIKPEELSPESVESIVKIVKELVTAFYENHSTILRDDDLTEKFQFAFKELDIAGRKDNYLREIVDSAATSVSSSGLVITHTPVKSWHGEGEEATPIDPLEFKKKRNEEVPPWSGGEETL